MRCLTLADGLRDQGVECQFVCRAHRGHLLDYIGSRGYAMHVLPNHQVITSLEPGLAHAHWLGVDWQTDVNQTLQALGGDTFDWLVVDHYALDYRWETALRSSCKRIMTIDDLADRQHNSDLLLDQNYGSSAERYQGLVPLDCTQCHGPKYALLKPVYAERRAQLPAHNGQVRRVLIYFGGGTLSADLTEMTLHAFQAPKIMNVPLDIVVGSCYAHEDDLKATAAARGRTWIYKNLADLSELMANADLAIGAGGSTTWERCCLGLPSIIISVAENQRPASEALAMDDLIQYLGHTDTMTPDIICEQVTELLGRPERLVELSEKGKRIVDGKGVGEIIEALRY